MIEQQTGQTASSWNQLAPRDAPFPASPFQIGMRQAGSFATYTIADTWYPSWGADDLTGPWRMVAYMENFGKQAYFLNFPSKFISADGERAWLCYSANFTNGNRHPAIGVDPAGSRYAMCLMEVEFTRGPLFASTDKESADGARPA